jgi:MSHA biogenesis protein MshP
MSHQSKNQKGFAAIAAIFLLVVLAALGGFMLTFSNAQHTTSAQDVQGSKAYWAAMAGLEWGLSSVVTGSISCPAPPGTFTKDLTLDAMRVAITCTARDYTEASTVRTIYQLTSVASPSGASVGGLSYVERSVSVALEK